MKKFREIILTEPDQSSSRQKSKEDGINSPGTALMLSIEDRNRITGSSWQKKAFLSKSPEKAHSSKKIKLSEINQDSM